MKTKLRFIIILTLLVVMLVMPTKAYAHGVDIEYTSSMTVEITARYDTGEPMSGAQVTIYLPDDQSTPWQTGICDDEGHFVFKPDTTIPGDWGVKVRKAGHGIKIYVPVSGEGSGGGSGYSVTQIILMSVCVVWGAIGTALFFIRRRKA
jgi:nickel transport protein